MISLLPLTLCLVQAISSSLLGSRSLSPDEHSPSACHPASLLLLQATRLAHPLSARNVSLPSLCARSHEPACLLSCPFCSYFVAPVCKCAFLLLSFLSVNPWRPFLVSVSLVAVTSHYDSFVCSGKLTSSGTPLAVCFVQSPLLFSHFFLLLLSPPSAMSVCRSGYLVKSIAAARGHISRVISLSAVRLLFHTSAPSPPICELYFAQ